MQGNAQTTEGEAQTCKSRRINQQGETQNLQKQPSTLSTRNTQTYKGRLTNLHRETHKLLRETRLPSNGDRKTYKGRHVNLRVETDSHIENGIFCPR